MEILLCYIILATFHHGIRVGNAEQREHAKFTESRHTGSLYFFKIL